MKYDFFIRAVTRTFVLVEPLEHSTDCQTMLTKSRDEDVWTWRRWTSDYLDSDFVLVSQRRIIGATWLAAEVSHETQSEELILVAMGFVQFYDNIHTAGKLLLTTSSACDLFRKSVEAMFVCWARNLRENRKDRKFSKILSSQHAFLGSLDSWHYSQMVLISKRKCFLVLRLTVSSTCRTWVYNKPCNHAFPELQWEPKSSLMILPAVDIRIAISHHSGCGGSRSGCTLVQIKKSDMSHFNLVPTAESTSEKDDKTGGWTCTWRE